MSFQGRALKSRRNGRFSSAGLPCGVIVYTIVWDPTHLPRCTRFARSPPAAAHCSSRSAALRTLGEGRPLVELRASQRVDAPTTGHLHPPTRHPFLFLLLSRAVLFFFFFAGKRAFRTAFAWTDLRAGLCCAGAPHARVLHHGGNLPARHRVPVGQWSACGVSPPAAGHALPRGVYTRCWANRKSNQEKKSFLKGVSPRNSLVHSIVPHPYHALAQRFRRSLSTRRRRAGRWAATVAVTRLSR